MKPDDGNAEVETPMSDHVARFWRHLETETVRIVLDLRREIGHDSPDGPSIYWDGSTFSDDVAKALLSERKKMAEEVAKAKHEVEICHARETCMCGEYVKEHSASNNHSPVSMYDYALDQCEAERKKLAAAAELWEDRAVSMSLTLEGERGVRAELEAERKKMREALEKWILMARADARYYEHRAEPRGVHPYDAPMKASLAALPEPPKP